MTAEQLWSPALNHWFPGTTRPLMVTLTARNIMDMYRFIHKNSQNG